MSPARVTTSPHERLPDGERGAGPRASSRRAAGAIDRDHLLERLQHLRGILPVFAQELASVRRQAAALRVENRGLLEEVSRLRRQRGEQPPGEDAATRTT